jgi:hypothetical protein
VQSGPGRSHLLRRRHPRSRRRHRLGSGGLGRWHLGLGRLDFLRSGRLAGRGHRARRYRWFPPCHDPNPHASVFDGRLSEGHQLIRAGCTPQSTGPRKTARWAADADACRVTESAALCPGRSPPARQPG